MSRALGPADYGALSALLGLLFVLTIPANALQMGVSAAVARAAARGEAPSMQGMLRRAAGYAALGGGATFAVLAAASGGIAAALHLDSRASVVAAGAVVIPWAMLPVLRGLLQGAQQPGRLGLSLAAEGVIKFAAGAGLVIAGAGLLGAIGGVALGAGGAALLTLALLQARLTVRRGTAAAGLRPLVSSVLPYAAAVGCFTVLTHADVVIARILLPARDAGLYAAASTGAKIVLYLTGALPLTLLPEVARRHAANQDGHDILLRSWLYGGAAGAALVLAYLVAPRLIIRLIFGPAFVEAAPLLGALGIAMLGFELALLGVYHQLGRRQEGLLWPIAGITALLPVLMWIFGGNAHTIATVIMALGLATFAVVAWRTLRGVEYARA
jgi:O-antigen/teichoic acid export membrane protein